MFLGVVPVGKDFFGDYRSYRDIINKLGSYQSTGDVTITVHTMGRSHEHRQLNVIRFLSRTSRPTNKLWISCGQHAREWIAPAACMYLIDKIVQGHSTDRRIARMLSRYEVLVAPLINPDGYEYSRLTYRYWRKNRRNNGFGRYGVDLNRNWRARWGAVGTSDNPSSDVFHGPAPESEPEVSATAKYLGSLKGVVAGVDVHSYGELVLRNYGWTTAPCPDEAAFAAIGDRIAHNMERPYGTSYISQRSGELYPAMGSMDDWFYETLHAMGMTFEMRDKGTYGFLLPSRFIVPVGEELLEGVLTLGESL